MKTKQFSILRFSVIMLIILCACCALLFGGCGKESVPPITTEPNIPEETEPNVPEETEPSEPDETEPSEPDETEPIKPVASEPQIPKDVLLMSTTDGLNIRSGKSTAFKVLGQIDKGDMLEFTEFVDGWYKVRYKNGYGYVSAKYASLFEFVKADKKTESVIAEGRKLLGTPYEYGAQRYHWGNGVKNTAFDIGEFDCSSLMQYIFKIGANVNLDTTSRNQSLQGLAVSKSDLKRGDLMFFTNDSRKSNSGIERIGHVGMYLGENRILHTASDYAVIEEINSKRWSYFITARRVL